MENSNNTIVDTNIDYLVKTLTFDVRNNRIEENGLTAVIEINKKEYSVFFYVNYEKKLEITYEAKLKNALEVFGYTIDTTKLEVEVEKMLIEMREKKRLSILAENQRRLKVILPIIELLYEDLKLYELDIDTSKEQLIEKYSTHDSGTLQHSFSINCTMLLLYKGYTKKLHFSVNYVYEKNQILLDESYKIEGIKKRVNIKSLSAADDKYNKALSSFIDSITNPEKREIDKTIEIQNKLKNNVDEAKEFGFDVVVKKDAYWNDAFKRNDVKISKRIIVSSIPSVKQQYDYRKGIYEDKNIELHCTVGFNKVTRNNNELLSLSLPLVDKETAKKILEVLAQAENKYYEELDGYSKEVDVCKPS